MPILPTNKSDLGADHRNPDCGLRFFRTFTCCYISQISVLYLDLYMLNVNFENSTTCIVITQIIAAFLDGFRNKRRS